MNGRSGAPAAKPWIKILGTVLALATACGDATAPFITAPRLRLAQTREFVAPFEQTETRQRGDFSYDEQGRLIRHELSTNAPVGQPPGEFQTIQTVVFSYAEDVLTSAEVSRFSPTGTLVESVSLRYR